MPSQGGFIAGYNAQIARGWRAAGHYCSSPQHQPADFSALVPLIDQTRTNLGRMPREVSGFANEANIAAVQDRRINPSSLPGPDDVADSDYDGGSASRNRASAWRRPVRLDRGPGCRAARKTDERPQREWPSAPPLSGFAAMLAVPMRFARN
jgi:hypothetical protein